VKDFKIKAFIALVVFAFLAYFTVPYWTHEVGTYQVNNSAVKAYADEHQKYLVFTDQGVFENTDTWYYFKFASSDLQGKLMQPGKFKLTYYGFRVPFLSKYKNIISAERIQ
jgi:hypothetical protein